MRLPKPLPFAIFLCLGLFHRMEIPSFATPSSQVFIPSPDVQSYGTFHLGVDVYLPVSKEAGQFPNTVVDLGLTAGILPFKRLNMEVGIDFIRGFGQPADDHPFYFNAKLAVPEDGLFKYSPALAVGGHTIGTTGANNFNLAYGLVAKTFPKVGRFSAGYYRGSKRLLVDERGRKDNHGLLLSWDRTLTEISDKLWAAIDFQGGNNSFGVLSFGVSWKFAPNVGVLLGYNVYNNTALANLENTFTMQIDIDFDFKRKGRNR